MAASNLNLGKASGGVLNIQPADGTTTTSLVLPAINGTVVAADSNGNVGIGAVPNTWYTGYTRAIEIGTAQDNGTIWSSLNQNHSHIGIGANFYMDSSFTPKYKASYTASQYSQSGGSHYWHTAPSGTAGNNITWTTAMTLDANGVIEVKGSVDSGYSGGMHTGVEGQHFIAYAGDTSNYTQIIANRTSNGSNYSFASVNGGILRARILDNGNFQSATNSYGSTSDAKLKENVQDASPKLDKLMQVQVRTFNYIGQEEKQIGVVAQEIEKIFPSIVYETKDTKQVEVEKEREVTLEDGTVDIEKYTEIETVETVETTKSVKYSVIYMMMLKGLQELNDIVKEQNEIIKDLKSRIEILEAK